MRIIRPGDPTYDQFVKGVRPEDIQCLKDGLSQEGTAGGVAFETLPLKQGSVEYAVIDTSDTHAKLVLHFLKVSSRFMAELSHFFYTKVRGIIIGPGDPFARMECGENPIFRSNWDVTILNLNKHVAAPKMRLILKALLKEFKP